MKWVKSFFLISFITQLALSFVINTYDKLQFNEIVLYKCWDLTGFDGNVEFKFNFTSINNQEELTVNITFKKLTQNSDDIQTTETQLYNLFSTKSMEGNVKYVKVDKEGRYCVSINENTQYQEPYKVDLTIGEQINPIDIDETLFYSRIEMAFGASILFLLVIMYQIKRLSDISPISKWLFSLVFLTFIFHSFQSFNTNPINNMLFEDTIGMVVSGWNLYVSTSIYFGRGYKNTGKLIPSTATYVLIFMVLLGSIGIIVQNTLESSQIVAREVNINGDIQEVYLFAINNRGVQNSYIESIVFGTSTVFATLQSLSMFVPYIYGYVIYTRLRESEQTTNAMLMMRTLLYDGIIRPIFWIFFGFFTTEHTFFLLSLEDYSSIIVLWCIWYSKRPYVIAEKTETSE